MMDDAGQTVGKAGAQMVPYTDKAGRRVPKFYRYVPTGVIYYRETFKKENIPALFKSTEATTLGKAKTTAKKMVQRHRNLHLGIKDDHIYGRAVANPFREVIAWAREHYTPKMRRRTQVAHNFFFDELDDWLGHFDVNSITRELFTGMIQKRRGKSRKVKNRDGTYRVSVRRTFSDYAKHMNLLMRIAYEDLKLATHLITFDNPDRVRSRLKLLPGATTWDDDLGPSWRVYTQAEISALWDEMGEDTRDQFALCYECLMRKREALHLTWDRVDLGVGKITLRPEDVKTGSKTGRGREFIMSPAAWERIRARAQKREPGNPWVFPSKTAPGKPVDDNKTAWTLVKRRAGVFGKATWHSLRHTALTEALLNEGKDPVKVSEYAGVSLETIQRVYLHSKAEQTKSVAGAIRIRTTLALMSGSNAEENRCEGGDKTAPNQKIEVEIIE